MSTPSQPFWNTNGTVASGGTWFCTPSSTGPPTQVGTAPIPPNAGKSMLIAQFAVNAGYSVHGTLAVQARAFPNPGGTLSAQFNFQCFCP